MIGIDLVSIKKLNSKANIRNLFTHYELSYAQAKPKQSQSLAGIFAAKEAVVKAYSLKLYDILRKNIEIIHINGKIVAFYKQRALDADISISHDGDYAVAACISNSCISNSKEIANIDPKMKEIFPKREKNSHKGDYGKIAIIGGSEGMAGSVYMASLAAMRAGAGLTYIIAPKSISEILQIKANEQIVLPVSSDNFYYDKEIKNQVLEAIKDKDVLALGPGMGKGDSLPKLIDQIIRNTDAGIVIDADGLNALSQDLSILGTKNNIILTPHLKEFERLSGIGIDEINQNREEIAKHFAKKHGIILVLKSENTLVTDGDKIYTNKIGNPGMATAGSGDVLCGIIAALLKRLSPFEAAILGIYLHSLAGDIAKDKLGEDSLLATDIIDSIPQAIKLLR